MSIPEGLSSRVLAGRAETSLGALQHGACTDELIPSDWFVPDGRDASTQENSAILVCSTCPVRRECWEFAVEVDESFGIWGGVLLEDEKARQVEDSGTYEDRRDVSESIAVGWLARERFRNTFGRQPRLEDANELGKIASAIAADMLDGSIPDDIVEKALNWNPERRFSDISSNMMDEIRSIIGLP